MLKLNERLRQNVLIMNILQPGPDLESFQKIFQQMLGSKSPLIIWQVFPENGKRGIHETFLTSFDLNLQSLTLTGVEEFLDPSLPVFCYHENQSLIFRSQVQELKDDSITLVLPQEIKHLEMNDVEELKVKTGLDLKGMWKTRSRYKSGVSPAFWSAKSMAERSARDQDFLNLEFDSLSLDEEDKLFADKRESPRVRPKKQKMVKVIKRGDPVSNLFELFDLSRGGMSFVTTLPDYFPKGSEIFVMGFDSFDLDDPLVGTVMGHRKIDDSRVDMKIGIKFIEGQA
jgi:hypothetical protein